ncbi:MAG: hypothetical protein HQK60_01825 [Deltaproteobacteria bacterium]|nr:hypothetical protein [Deltaproteobacteria bacterium]
MSHEQIFGSIISGLVILLSWAGKMLYNDLKRQIIDFKADSEQKFSEQRLGCENKVFKLENKMDKMVPVGDCLACSQRLDKLESETSQLFNKIFDTLSKHSDDLSNIRAEMKIGLNHLSNQLTTLSIKIDDVCSGRYLLNSQNKRRDDV